MQQAAFIRRKILTQRKQKLKSFRHSTENLRAKKYQKNVINESQKRFFKKLYKRELKKKGMLVCNTTVTLRNAKNNPVKAM